jgi:hypothetical protein
MTVMLSWVHSETNLFGIGPSGHSQQHYGAHLMLNRLVLFAAYYD